MFDTTGIGYFEPGKDVPDAKALTELLNKERMPRIKVTRVAEVELPKPDGAFEVSISGLN